MRGDDSVAGEGRVVGVPRFLQSNPTRKETAPQYAHGRLVLQVYLGSNTLEFSAIRR